MAKQKVTKLTLPPGRLSYPSLFEKSELDGKYSATVIWPDGTDLTELEALIDQVVKDKWANKVPKNLRVPLKDCEEKTTSAGEPVAGYENGGRYLKAWTKQRPPRVVGREKDPTTNSLIELPEHEVYAGCWVRLSVSVFANHNEKFGTNDVICGLLNVQKWADDEAFGGIISDPDDDFGVDDAEVKAALGDDAPF